MIHFGLANKDAKNGTPSKDKCFAAVFKCTQWLHLGPFYKLNVGLSQICFGLKRPQTQHTEESSSDSKSSEFLSGLCET